MALTINRKNEITEREFNFLKNNFDKGTNSQALYAAIKYLIYEVPNYKKDFKNLEKEHKELVEKYDVLIMAIEIKKTNNSKRKNIVSKKMLKH